MFSNVDKALKSTKFLARLASSERQPRLPDLIFPYFHSSLSPIHHILVLDATTYLPPLDGRQDVPPRQKLPPRRPQQRHLPNLQIQPLPQPLPPIPNQPRMLPPNVLHVRRPNIHLRPRLLSCPSLRQNTTQERLPCSVLRRPKD